MKTPWSELRSRFSDRSLGLFSVAYALVFGTGAAAAFAFGKFLLGVLLAAFACGVYARFTRRKKTRRSDA